METSNLTTSIIETINSIFETLFSSIDTTIYSVLDELTFIDKNILNNSVFQKIFGSTGNNGLLVIANSLLVGFSLYYAIRLIYSYYMNLQIERPYQFIFKLLIFGIVMNCSYFICNQFIQINSFISDAIRTVGSNIFGHDISFSELINKLNYLSIKENEFNIFSFSFFNASILEFKFSIIFLSLFLVNSIIEENAKELNFLSISSSSGNSVYKFSFSFCAIFSAFILFLSYSIKRDFKIELFKITSYNLLAYKLFKLS